MTTGSEWQDRVGHSWAREWRRTDRSFGALTDRLLETARADDYRAALDIGCGAGELTLRLAKAAPDAEHLGIDISEELVAVARQRTDQLGNARIALADASIWETRKEARPDLLVSRHGVMFFPQPVEAFAHIREQAAPGGRLVFSCFRARQENIWAQELASVLEEPTTVAEPNAPGPFAFGDRDYVADLLAQAGWQDVQFTGIDYAMVAGAGPEPVADAVSYFRAIGPTARAIAELEGARQDAAIERLASMLESHRKGVYVSLPAACWIVSATS